MSFLRMLSACVMLASQASPWFMPLTVHSRPVHGGGRSSGVAAAKRSAQKRRNRKGR
ncbi:hypothetical protein [Deefgea piscis]|uniref:hypothetical protein n=1 Tax=Deefgea piscis TaxID=2739061 RepID=UPI001C7E90E1|nr:hypothetical protein [Deefgea piscis]QZA80190.1 hypothetical protein K4H25_11670 [Deefgea piscis]